MGTKKILFFPDRCFDCSVHQIETVPAAVIGVKAQQLYVPTPVHRRTTKQSGRRYKDEKKMQSTVYYLVVHCSMYTSLGNIWKYTSSQALLLQTHLHLRLMVYTIKLHTI